MRQFLYCDKGYRPIKTWQDDCWVDMELPDEADINFLVDELGVPLTFIEDLRDIDERPRVDQESGWILTILRIPMPEEEDVMPYTTVPLGVMTNGQTVVTVCFFKTGLPQDFIGYSCRKQLTVTRRTDFILHILFNATFWFLSYLKQMNEEVTGAERAIEIGRAHV